MGHNVRFLMTPDECEATVGPFVTRLDLHLWQFPEAATFGRIVRMPALAGAPGRLVWIGEPPVGTTEWDSYQAATTDGFVCCVRPIIDQRVKTLYLGEIFTPASDLKASRSWFGSLKRELGKMLEYGTTAHLDTDPSAKPSRGPKMSKGALQLYRSGSILRQQGVGRIHYEPVLP